MGCEECQGVGFQVRGEDGDVVGIGRGMGGGTVREWKALWWCAVTMTRVYAMRSDADSQRVNMMLAVL